MSHGKGKGYNTRFKTIDTLTGEEVVGTPVFVAGKARWDHLIKGGWFVGFQEAFTMIAQDKEMTGESYRVWAYLLGCLGFENFIVLERSKVANSLGIKGPNVSRAINQLIKKGLLIRGPKVGKTYAYRLGLNVAFRGDAKAFDQNKKELQRKTAEELAQERWKVFKEVHACKEFKKK